MSYNETSVKRKNFEVTHIPAHKKSDSRAVSTGTRFSSSHVDRKEVAHSRTVEAPRSSVIIESYNSSGHRVASASH